MRTTVAILALLSLPCAAMAGKAEDDAAREHYEKAQIHYKLGEFEQALIQYRETYRFKPLPALLFNIAQCYRQLNNWERARFYYRNYLNDAKSPPNRAEVEQLIAEATKKIEEQERAAAPPPAAPAPVATATPAPAPAAAPAPAPAPAAAPAPAPAPAAAPAPAPAPAAAPAPATVAAPAPPSDPKPAPAATPVAAPPKPPPAAPPPAAAATSPAAAPAPKPSAPPTAVAAQPPATGEEKGFPVLGAVGAGASLLLAGGAALFLVQALGTEQSLREQPHEREEIVTLLNQAGTNRTLALALGASAGVALAVGVVGFVF